MKEITIRQSRLEFALECIDKDITNLVYKVECFGQGSSICISYKDEIRGSLSTLLFLGIISNEEYHNVMACLHECVFGRTLDLASDQE